MGRRNTTQHATQWSIPDGLYTPVQIIQKISPLLETVLSVLGKDAPGSQSSRKLLLTNLVSCLSTNSNESALFFPETASERGQAEVQTQAKRIGDYIAKYISQIIPEEKISNITIRSQYQGHLWTPAVANLLMGPRSNRELMQLYNEFLHQSILLRDSLLPFENYQDVLYYVRETNSGPGLRGLEQKRLVLLAECHSRSISQKTLVEIAKTFTAPDLPIGGYGFQYSSGIVLPAFLAGSSSLHLLKFCPATLDASAENILFDYQYRDYYDAPRTEISAPFQKIPAHTWPNEIFAANTQCLVACSLMVVKSASEPNDTMKCQLQLRLEFKHNDCVSVDIGQIARGRRYSTNLYMAKPESNEVQDTTLLSKTTFLHKVFNVLSLPGLVTSNKAETHVIPGINPIIRLALIGKLYPHNVFMLDGKDGLACSERVGARFGARFLILGGRSENCSGISGSVLNAVLTKEQ